jgi:hypothetical protein
MPYFIGLMLVPLFSGYCQDTTLEEAVYATVSEDYLMPREKLWVSIFVTHQDKPTTSKIVYMELLNRDFVPVIQEITELSNGLGNGYLTIPDNLPTDYYLLRVYTRNSPFFSTEQGIYHQLIGIINPDISPINSSKPIDGTFFSTSNNSFEITPDTFQFKSDGERLNVQLHGNASDILTVSIAYRGQFPPIPTINPSKLYDSLLQPTTYVPELFGHIIHGKNLDRSVDTTETFFLSAHGLASKFLIGKPSISGDVYFETGGFSHFNYVIIQSDAEKDQLDFVVESPFLQQKPTASFIIPYLELSESLMGTLQERMIASHAATYYRSWIAEPKPSNPRLFLPDKTYLLDDYNRFDDMATVIREYVPEILVRREDSKTVFRSVNRPANQVFKNNPLILIDALPILDSDAFSKFNPAGIRQMDILNRQLYLNDQLYDGAIVMTSFENDFGKFDLPKNALFIEYKGIQFPLTDIEFPADNQQLATLGSLVFWDTLSLNNNNTNLSLPIPQLKGNYKITVTNWNKINEPSAQNRALIQIK